MKLYMRVTSDEYELPIAVSDSVVKLAQMLGVSPTTVYCGLRRYRLGIKTPYRVVNVDD